MLTQMQRHPCLGRDGGTHVLMSGEGSMRSRQLTLLSVG
jgi:hypothetical protein